MKAAGVHVDAKPNEKTKSLYALTKSYVRRKWGIRQNLFVIETPEDDEAGVCLFAKSKQAQLVLKRTFPQKRISRTNCRQTKTQERQIKRLA